MERITSLYLARYILQTWTLPTMNATITNPEKFRLALNAAGKAWRKRVRLLNRALSQSKERAQRRMLRRIQYRWNNVAESAQARYCPK